MIEPIKIQYDLPLSAVDAFTCYALRIGDWWPAGFTAYGDDGLDTIIIEPLTGGRIYERSHDGSIYDWGVVRAFVHGIELVHSFHLAQDKQHPTEVAVTLMAVVGCTSNTATGVTRTSTCATNSCPWVAGGMSCSVPSSSSSAAKRTADKRSESR